MKALLFVFLALAVAAVSANPYRYSRNESYAGESVIRCPLSEELSAKLDNLVNEHDLDLWAVHAETKEVDLRVRQYQVYGVQELFGGQCYPYIADLEARVREFETANRNSFGSADWHAEYHRYAEIVGFYRDLSVKFGNIVRFIPSIGKSHEGRDQPAVVITGNRGGAKRSIYFQFAIHAREWISPATGMYVLESLVKDYANGEPEAVKILDAVEIHAVLFTNPDGYEWTWESSRLWRKSRAPNAGSSCVGTDLNRNYNDHWGKGGSSDSPCSDTFMGRAAASEPEVRNTVAYFKSIRPVIGAIDFHSYSQLLLRPYGWTRDRSPHEAEHVNIGARMAEAIRSSSGLNYQNIRSIDLYTTTGTASDWFYGEEATNGNGGFRAVSYTIELRDTGRYGFVLPPDQIIPTGKEIYAALRVALPMIIANPLRA